MAYFALLWKARTIQKYKNDYEIEKLNTIILSEKCVDDAFSSQKLWHCRRRFYGVLRKFFPEGSSVYVLIKYLRTDQTFPNFVLKSVIGFVGGVVLTYLCFLFFVFQLSISLVHATIMSSILGVLLTLGLAFSYRVRCLVFLVIPQFFSRVGRYTLTCYALVLILTGPATNALKNSEALSECMANGQEQVKAVVRDINESVKNPHNAFKDNVNILIQRGKQTADKVTDLVLKIHRLTLSIVSVIHSSFGWLSSQSRTCNKKLQSPYEHCANALNVASLDCQAKYGPWKYWLCDVGFVTKQACEIKAPLKSFCVKIDYVNEGLRNSLRKKLRAFFDRVEAMLSLEVKVHHSYVMSSTGKPLNQTGSSGIVTEIRHRANPLLTWLSWSSYLTSASALIILFRSKYYQNMYETRSRYDNRYITKELRQLDLKRSRQGRETVLPLNRREKGKYIKPTSFRLLGAEKVSLGRSIVFMVTTTFKLMIHIVADFSLYWILKIIRYHGKRQAPFVLQSTNTILVQGSKPAASILRSMVDSVSPDFMSFPPNLIVTLPDPYPPDFERYGQIGILICLLWFFALFEPYGLRLRHFVMGLYRPERAKARAMWLYHHILRTRSGFMKYARRKLHREYKYTSEAKYTFRNWLHSHIPFKWFISDPVGRNCLLCNTVENIWDADSTLIWCETPNCPGTFCTRCFSDIGQLCTICMRPADYGDISDVSLEKGSSAESSDSDNDSLGPGQNKLSKFIYNKKKKYKKFLKKDIKVKSKTQEEISLLKSHSQETSSNEEKTYRNKSNKVKHLKHLTDDLVKKYTLNFQIYCQDCNYCAGDCNKYSNDNKRYRLVDDEDKSCFQKSLTTTTRSSSTEIKNKQIGNDITKCLIKLTNYSPSRNFKRKVKHKRDMSIQKLGLSETSPNLMKRRRRVYLFKVRKRTRRNQKSQWLSEKVISVLQVSASTIAKSVSSSFNELMKKRLRRRGKRYIKFKILGLKIEFEFTKQKSSMRLRDIYMQKQASICNPNNKSHTKTTRPQNNTLNSFDKSNSNTPQEGATGDKSKPNIKNPTGTSDDKFNDKVAKRAKKELDLDKITVNKGKIKNACLHDRNNTYRKLKKPEDKPPEEDTLVNYKRRKKVDLSSMNQVRHSKGMRDLKIESFFASHEWMDEPTGVDYKFETAQNLHELENIRQSRPVKEMEHVKDNTRRGTPHSDHRKKSRPSGYGDVMKTYNVFCERQGSSARVHGDEYDEDMEQESRKKWYHNFPFFNFFKSLFTCTQCTSYWKQRKIEQMEQHETVDHRRTRHNYQSCVSPHIDRKQNKINVAIAQNRSALNICQGNVEINATVPTCTCAVQYVGKDNKCRNARLHTRDATTLHFNAGKVGLKMKDKSTLHFDCLKSTCQQQLTVNYDKERYMDRDTKERDKDESDTAGTQYHRPSNKKSVVKFENYPTRIEFEDQPTRMKLKDPPSRIKFEASLTPRKFENHPNCRKIEDPPSRIMLENPTSPACRKFKEPLTHIKFEVPPTHIKLEDPPTRIKIEDPPTRIKFEVAPNRNRMKSEDSPTTIIDPKDSTNSHRISNQTPKGNKSDTAVYKNQNQSKFTPGEIYKKRKIKTGHKEDKSTVTDSVCNASTITSDWWSPIEEMKEMAPLEKKRGTYLMSGRKRHVKKLKNRGVWTEERTVKFKSNTQIIPPAHPDCMESRSLNTGSDSNIAAAENELLTPLRYLLESQKYYNELYTPWFNTPLSVMSLQKAEQNLLTRGVASEDNLSLICNYGT